MKEFWESRYQEPTFAYGTRPNEFFQEHINKIPPGKILLPAEGEGRNAVYAARKGWEVTAFDFSMQAMLKTFQLAERYDVTLNYTVQDVAKFESNGVAYDVIGLFFAHFPPPLRKTFHQKLPTMLKKSGYVLLEAFHPNQLYYSSGGPKEKEMLLTLEDLEIEFKDLNILMLEDRIVELDEGPYHQGKAHVVRMIATKTD